MVAAAALLAVPALRGTASPKRDAGRSPAAAAASGSPSSSPSPSPVGPATCLIGRWRETVAVSTVRLEGVDVTLRAEGAVGDFRRDGTVVHDGGGVYRGEAGGHSYELSFTGPVFYNYIVSGDKILYTDKRSDALQIYKRDGRVRARDKLNADASPETFVCRGDILRLNGDQYSVELVRAG